MFGGFPTTKRCSFEQGDQIFLQGRFFHRLAVPDDTDLHGANSVADEPDQVHGATDGNHRRGHREESIARPPWYQSRFR